MGQDNLWTGVKANGARIEGGRKSILSDAHSVCIMCEDDARKRGVPFRGTLSTAGTSHDMDTVTPLRMRTS